ncbi:MAG: hypothetical protein Q4D06_04910 [Coriobacteriia bacterium]|nr:hypothetical protein [Coriobacteriia bacterium]
MPQTSIYLDDRTASLVRGEAQRQGLSLSKLVGRVLNEYATSPRDAWPPGYWEDVYGCLGEVDVAAMPDDAGESCLDPALDDACDWWA